MTIRVIAYTYDGREHCVECSRKRFADYSAAVGRGKEADENNIRFEAKDSDGNPVCAILNIENTAADLKKSEGGRSLLCGTCGTIIKLHLQSLETRTPRGCHPTQPMNQKR